MFNSRLGLILLALLLVARGASAQVVFDANETADCSGSAIVGTTGKTCANLTVGSGANRALVCQLGFSLQTASSQVVTWDSGGTNQALASIIQVNTATGTTGRAELWGLVAPTSGAKTLKVTWVGTSDLAINCVSWTGVDQTGGATTFPHSTSATGNSTAAAQNMAVVTSATNNATMDALVTTGTPSAPLKTQTFLDASTATISSAGSRTAGAATVTFGWTVTNAALPWVDVGTDVLASTGGAACTPTLTLLGVGRCG